MWADRDTSTPRQWWLRGALAYVGVVATWLGLFVTLPG
jgi:hypothetical protein